MEKWKDGSVYEGEYRNGKKNGHGTYIWADKSKFVGDWRDNKISGRVKALERNINETKRVLRSKGTYVWADNRKYEGDWLNNNMDGRGIYTWADGRVFEGLKRLNVSSHGFFVWDRRV